jgi:hypothetical protein
VGDSNMTLANIRSIMKNSIKSKATLSVVTVGLLSLLLVGCAPSGSSTPADLSGDWTQSNSQSEDSYQTATITNDEITIYWVSNGGDTKALYWAGTYEAPSEPGAYEWVSENDTSQTDSALLASGAPDKTFSFDGNEISYEVSALGSTTTVRLERD